MITRLEIDGFKTFRDLAIDLAPLQAIVGAGGTGKSNLFDALRLLAHLAEGDLRAAFQEVRGEPSEIFSLLPDGSTARRIRIAAEMLVEPQVRDDWGAQADVKYTRMRYEIEIARQSDERRPDRFRVIHEALLPIQRSLDPWARRHIGRGRDLWLPTLRTGRTVPFISTEAAGERSTIYLHQDGRGGDMAAAAQGAERTVLSTISNTEFPHAFAAREEMRAWRSVELETRAIRNMGQTLPHSFIGPDGGNLAAALLRMKGENPYILGRFVRDLAPLLPGIAGIEVEERGPWGDPFVSLLFDDGGSRSLPVLSGGALRVLALSALKNDPDIDGVLALEEPENGLDRSAIRAVVPLLQGMSSDLDSAEAAGGHLRQLLFSTHSVPLVEELILSFLGGRDEPVHELPQILFAHTGQGESGTGESRFSCISPSQQLALGFGFEEEGPRYTLADVERALRTAP